MSRDDISTLHQELLEAAHDLLGEIERSDYEDMVGSADRVNRLKKVSGFPSKVRVFGEPQGTLTNNKSNNRFFDVQTYTGDNSAARKNFEETTKVLPPMGCKTGRNEWVGLTDEDCEEVISNAMQDITSGANTFTLSASKVWGALVRAVETKLKEKNT